MLNPTLIQQIRERHAAFKEKQTEEMLLSLFEILGPNLESLLEAAEKKRKRKNNVAS